MPYKCETIIEKVKAKVAAADPDPSKRTILAVFLFSITDGGKVVKTYTVDLKKLEVYEGAYKGDGPVVNLTVDDEYLEKMLKKEVTMDEAKAAGKLSSDGDAKAIADIKALVLKLIS